MSAGIEWHTEYGVDIYKGDFGVASPPVFLRGLLRPSRVESIIMDEAAPPPRARHPRGAWDTLSMEEQERAYEWLGIPLTDAAQLQCVHNYDRLRQFILNGAAVSGEKDTAAPAAEAVAHWYAALRGVSDKLFAYTATPTTEEVERAFPWLPKEMREPVRLALCHFIAGRAERNKKETGE